MSSSLISYREKFASPFPYFVSSQAFEAEASARVLSWLEETSQWNLTIEEFYEQYEFSLLHVDLPQDVRFLVSDETLARLKQGAEQTFDVVLSGKIDVTVHKLVHGQTIKLHNDHIPGQETHRILIQLNRGWEQDYGGLLIFFNSHDAADIHRVFCPVHNSCVGFEISQKSNHAVSTVHAGERFTLVYSFYQQGRN